MDYKKLYAVKAKNEKRIKELCPSISETSGIYVFKRKDKNGIKYAYVGQAINLLQRTAQHLSGYQHIDLSIKKHGLYDAKTCPYGWWLIINEEPDVAALNDMEQQYIKAYAQMGYQLRNATTGSQGEGKKIIADYGRGGYLKGKHDGEQKAIKRIAELIAKYTNGITSKGSKLADRKTAELKEILGGEDAR